MSKTKYSKILITGIVAAKYNQIKSDLDRAILNKEADHAERLNRDLDRIIDAMYSYNMITYDAKHMTKHGLTDVVFIAND